MVKARLWWRCWCRPGSTRCSGWTEKCVLASYNEMPMSYRTTVQMDPDLAVTAMVVCACSYVVFAAQKAATPRALWMLPLADEGPQNVAPVTILPLTYVDSTSCLAAVPQRACHVVVATTSGKVYYVDVSTDSCNKFCDLANVRSVAATQTHLVAGTSDCRFNVYDIKTKSLIHSSRRDGMTCVGARLHDRTPWMYAVGASLYAFGAGQEPVTVSTALHDSTDGTGTCVVAPVTATTLFVQVNGTGMIVDVSVPDKKLMRYDNMQLAAPYGTGAVIVLRAHTNKLVSISNKPCIIQFDFLGDGAFGCAYKHSPNTVPARVLKIFASDRAYRDEVRAAKAITDLARTHKNAALHNVVSVLTDTYEDLALNASALAACRKFSKAPLPARVRGLMSTYAGVPLRSDVVVPRVTAVTIAVALQKLLDGLDVLLELNLIHADLHQDNVMLKDPKTMVMIDFGMVANILDAQDARQHFARAEVLVSTFIRDPQLRRPPFHRPWQMLVCGLRLRDTMASGAIAAKVVSEALLPALEFARYAPSAAERAQIHACVTEFALACQDTEREAVQIMMWHASVVADVYNVALAGITAVMVHAPQSAARDKFAAALLQCVLLHNIFDMYGKLRELVGGAACSCRDTLPVPPFSMPPLPPSATPLKRARDPEDQRSPPIKKLVFS